MKMYGVRFKRKGLLSGKSSYFSYLFSAGIILISIFFAGNISGHIDSLVLLCAGISMPEGGKTAAIEVFHNFLETQPSTDNTAETSPPAPQTTGVTVTTLSETSTTKTSEEETSDDSGGDTSPIFPVNAGDSKFLTKTPDDVAAVMKSAVTLQKNAATGGTIVEKTFSKADSTDSYERINVKNVTESTTINIAQSLKNGIKLDIKDNSKPAVLIYHSHTTESYCLTNSLKFSKNYTGKTEDTDINMVRIGDEITEMLESAGVRVIHDRNIYDIDYNSAYDLSRAAVEKHLKDNPSIQITLDVHRDAIHSSSTQILKPVTKIFEKKAAQIMIITGAQEGKITVFKNWQQNLDFALTLYKYADNMYAGLMKPIFFCQRKYNMDLGKYSVLLEMGTDANTLEEAVYSARLIGNALAAVIGDFS